MGVIADRDQQLNEAIGQGRVLEVFRDIYHPDVVMEEATGESWEGLDTNFAREQEFYGSIETFHGGGVSGGAVDEANGRSYATMAFDATLKNGHRMKMTEVAERVWKDGRIVRERFYYNA